MKLVVEGMTCGHCVRTITGAIGKIAPGSAVAIDLETGEVSISGDIDLATAVKAIGDEGYPVVAILAAGDSSTVEGADRRASCCGSCSPGMAQAVS